MRDRIKFFSVYDLSIGFYIDKLKEKLDLFNSNIDKNKDSLSCQTSLELL